LYDIKKVKIKRDISKENKTNTQIRNENINKIIMLIRTSA